MRERRGKVIRGERAEGDGKQDTFRGGGGREREREANKQKIEKETKI